MEAERAEVRRVVDALRDELGADRVLGGAPAADEVQRRSLNPLGEVRPLHLLRPRNTEECRVIFQALAAVDCYPHPIAALTTFWEPHSPTPDVGLDTLGMRTPCRIDPRERVGYFGAGVSVREADRAARAHGLCLVAYPDSDGSASVGSMAAVACTTGLGLGRLQPLDQIAGLTAVTRDAAVLRTGAAWRLGRGGVAHGIPDPMGIFLGAQGRFGVITEVLLTLAPAPFLAARTWSSAWTSPGEIADQLRRARHVMDAGTVDSLRLETICAGRAQPAATEWFARCWAPESAAEAEARCAAVARGLEARDARRWVESEAARRGELPGHDERYSVPPGEHHARTGAAGFLGIEVNVNWGDQLDSALRLFADLFTSLQALDLGHRRLGIYPSSHAVSIGIQAMLSGGDATADAVRHALGAIVAPLDAIGAVPYRPGRIWKETTDRREVEDPTCAMVRRAGLREDPS